LNQFEPKIQLLSYKFIDNFAFDKIIHEKSKWEYHEKCNKMGGYNLYVVRLSLILFLGSVLCSACDDADLLCSADGL
jgi:hypothetical protein